MILLKPSGDCLTKMLDANLIWSDQKEILFYEAGTSGTFPHPILSRIERLRKELAGINDSGAIAERYLNPDRLFPRSIATFSPKTELAKQLWEIRNHIVASGEKLLTWDDLVQEIADRRGEQD